MEITLITQTPVASRFARPRTYKKYTRRCSRYYLILHCLEHKILCSISGENERYARKVTIKKFAQRRTPPNHISRDWMQNVDSHNGIGETIGLPYSAVKKKEEKTQSICFPDILRRDR